jgi:ammonia channel protein AmtB
MAWTPASSLPVVLMNIPGLAHFHKGVARKKNLFTILA